MLTKQEQTYIKNIQKKIGKTIFQHKLIKKNDRVMVGLSGGKDSLILLESLANRKKYLPFEYKLIAAHIEIDTLDYKIDFKFLEQFCKNLGVEFHIINRSIKFAEENKISPCFICSWHRRSELFKLTNKFNCNKLALGHHLDDAIETLLMNMVNNGEISSLPYKLSMFKGRFELIRPMLDTEESLLIRYADLKDFNNKEIKKCHFDDKTKRKYTKDLLSKLELDNKDAKKNIFRSMFKIIPTHLPKKV